MTVLVRASVRISLHADCPGDGCAAFALKNYSQLASGRYDWPCSVQTLPASIDVWRDEHRTARKRVNHAERGGYQFAEIRRERFADDIYLINTSRPERQGRPMSAGYLERPRLSPLPDYPCPLHRVYTYGVLDPHDRLRAYTWVYRVGDLVMFSQILGHDDHLDQHVMYLLVQGALEQQIAVGAGVAFYNRHDSGTDGLRFFKERLGFQPARVEWSK